MLLHFVISTYSNNFTRKKFETTSREIKNTLPLALCLDDTVLSYMLSNTGKYLVVNSGNSVFRKTAGGQ